MAMYVSHTGFDVCPPRLRNESARNIVGPYYFFQISRVLITVLLCPFAMSAEDAVAKAKAIAAKLSGAVSGDAMPAATLNTFDIAKAAEAALAGLESAAAAAGGMGGSGGAKRKRWGVAAEDADGTAEAEKRIKHEAQKRLWISTSDKPASHYRLYWEMHGQSITRQVSAGEIALSLEGRGSSQTPALPGIPEQVCSIRQRTVTVMSMQIVILLLSIGNSRSIF